ncbi:YhcN/YlaJ family sporulation lipoprotein [Evansella halocellulosilytica]|uniref:YhcN/YlaJ family sporulation lipoprotein n=1 Tax=Evansella halocellulosilytica TaxID=2011013 RepID=UPI000BB8AA6F|nr:YhcN/YlaJ family sporulation lipoprotein [Evansella halocellulosilytica]
MRKSLIFFLVPILLFIGCRAPEYGTDTNPIEAQQYGGYGGQEMSANEIANHLANISTQVPDVNSATAIVLGPYALVGINVEGEIDQSEVGSIKYQVAEALSDDPYGAQAAVTADADIVNRIEEMRVEMGQGRPLTAIADELAAIVGRLIPVVPSEEHQQADPIESNQKQTSEPEGNELEDIQDEQSDGRISDKKRHD